MNKQVNVDQLPSIKCDCGNETFEQITFLKCIPAIMAGALADQLLPLPVFRCCRCKNLFDFGKYDRKAAEDAQKKGKFFQ